MECVQRIVIGSIGDEKRRRGAALFDLFIGICCVYHCTVRAYVLWRMLQKTEYDLFYLPRSNTRTGEVVFCIIYIIALLDSNLEIIWTQRDVS